MWVVSALLDSLLQSAHCDTLCDLSHTIRRGPFCDSFANEGILNPGLGSVTKFSFCCTSRSRSSDPSDFNQPLGTLLRGTAPRRRNEIRWG